MPFKKLISFLILVSAFDALNGEPQMMREIGEVRRLFDEVFGMYRP